MSKHEATLISNKPPHMKIANTPSPRAEQHSSKNEVSDVDDLIIEVQELREALSDAADEIERLRKQIRDLEWLRDGLMSSLERQSPPRPAA